MLCLSQVGNSAIMINTDQKCLLRVKTVAFLDIAHLSMSYTVDPKYLTSFIFFKREKFEKTI